MTAMGSCLGYYRQDRHRTLKGNKLFISNWPMVYLKRFVMIILVAALQQKVLVIFAFDLH